MLLFIGLFNLATKGCDSFQYISCYCLSYTNHCFRLVHIHFNTSHVTVYQILVMHHAFSFLISIHLMLLFIRMAAVGGERSIVFQYISCYCLSRGDDNKNTIREIFQYISCYCLSISNSYRRFIRMISIHLMLLFIRNESLSICKDCNISIHLMLLFI